MTWQEIDFAFPFIVFGYGFILTLVLSHPRLMQIAEQRLPFPLYENFKSKRLLGLTCLIVGFFWSLQNLWLG